MAFRNAVIAGFDRRILRMPFWHIVDHACKSERLLAIFEVQNVMLSAYIKDGQNTDVLASQMIQTWEALAVERKHLLRAIELLQECRTSEQLVN